MVSVIRSETDNPENQNFKKIKEAPGETQKIKIKNKIKQAPRYIINLHKCTINNNNMMYGS